MLKTASSIFTIMLIFSGLYGLLVTFDPQMIAESTLKARAGKVLADVEDPAVANVFVSQTRHLGVFALCITIALFYVLFKGFKKGEKWAWWTFLFAGGIGYGFGLVVQILEVDVLNLILHAIGTGLLLVGLLISYKAFPAKTP